MSIFYLPPRPDFFRRYVGLSCIVHAASVLVLWSVLKDRVGLMKTSGIEVSIRTIASRPKPMIQPRPGQPGASLAQSMPALKRKIGRIVEKKFKINMPKVEPRMALRRNRTEDEVQLANSRKIARFIRSENVEPIDVERKEAAQLPKPPGPAPDANAPAGEYVPLSAQIPADISIQYVEVPFTADKIDLDAVQWSPAVTMKRDDQGTSAGGDAALKQIGRQRLKYIEPEVPPNLGAQVTEVIVILRLKIAESGFVSAVEIEQSSGYPDLDNNTLAAARQWQYESAPKKEEQLVKLKYVL